MTPLRPVLRAVWLAWLTALVVVVACHNWAYAQPTSPASAEKQPESQVESTAEGLILDGITLAPYSRPRAGRPLVIVAIVRNKSSIPRSTVAVAKIDSAPDFQAGTLVEIPPHQQRSVELRARVPETAKVAVEFTVSLNDPDNPNQVLLSPSKTPLIDQRRMTLLEDTLVTALAIRPSAPFMPEWYWPQNDIAMEYEFIVAARADSSHPRRTLTIDHENMPTQVADWQGLDEIVISTNRPLQDTAVVKSMNRWIAGGGRAWIMFDQTDPVNIRDILPDGMSCEMLDDVDLNRFTVESTAFGKLKESDRTVELEKPVRLRRVVQTGGDVSLSIDKYPVAIWYRVGKGMVLLTTLAPEGWLEPRNSQRRPGEEYRTAFQMRAWAVPVADRLHEPKPMTAPIEAVEVQYAMQQIGNPVLERSYVLTIVFGFCGLLCAIAGICKLTNQMSRLSWLVPLVSLAATMPLLIASAFQRRDIPDTTAHLQLIEVQPGSQTIQATQWTAAYLTQTQQDKLVGDGDAVVTWPRSAEQLDLRRWTWRDYGSWELTSSGWPSGLWQLKSRFALPPMNLDVVARIDEQGLQLKLPAALEHALADAVVQFSPGNPVPCGPMPRDEIVRVPEQHLSQIESWLTDSIVDDEQRRREQVYRQLQAVEGQPGFPSYPAVFGWTNLWDSPVAWSNPRDQRGSALLVLPIKLLPTASGERVHVPHSVIQVGNTTGFVSTAFSIKSGWWRAPTSLPAKVNLRFTLPKQVCPIQADEINLHIQMRAPQRKAIVSAVLPNGEIKLIKEFISPTGMQAASLVDPIFLDDIRDGGIDLQLEITPEISHIESPLGDQQAIWQVDYFRMSVDGQVENR